MKTLRILPFVGLLLAFVLSCQKEKVDDVSFLKAKKTDDAATTSDEHPAKCDAYVVTLVSKKLVNGKWEWIWSIQNTDPTVAPDLSYWEMQFGDCFKFEDVYSASYGCICGQWTYFTPTYAVDPGQRCSSLPALKFPKGTSGTNKTYYRLLLNKDYSVDINAKAVTKSVCGCCCNITFCGIGCPPVTSGFCGLTQGYWFARPKTVWCQGVAFGANNYSQAQGKAIWSNAPNNSAVKHAFTQASALQLSMICKNGGAAIPADIADAYNTCVTFLSTLSYNDILTGEYPPADYNTLQEAAGAIGDWLPKHHCGEDAE